MAGVGVKGLEERRGDKGQSARPQGPKELGDGGRRKLQMFQDSLAMKGVDRALGLGKGVGIRRDVDIGERGNVEIDQGRMDAHRSTAHRNAQSIVRKASETRAE